MTGENAGKDGFLSRWSRRKSEERGKNAREEPEAEPPVPPAAEAPGETDAELLVRLDLPEPETLGGEDDFSDYLKAPLSAALRRRALRRLWMVKPELANLDGLLDYNEDFNAPAELGQIVKTAYRAGWGFFKSEPEASNAQAGQADAMETAAVDEADTAEPGELPQAPDADEPDAVSDGGDDEEPCRASRMRFSFDPVS